MAKVEAKEVLEAVLGFTWVSDDPFPDPDYIKGVKHGIELVQDSVRHFLTEVIPPQPQHVPPPAPKPKGK